MKRQGYHHRKVKRLARFLSKLGCTAPMPTARGVLEGLWYATATEAPHGDIGRIDNDDIADLIGWDGDSDDLVAALVEAEWLDETTEPRLLTHDWPEHADKHVPRAVLRSLRRFPDGSRPQISEGEKPERAAWIAMYGKSPGARKDPVEDTSGGSAGQSGARSIPARREVRRSLQTASHQVSPLNRRQSWDFGRGPS